MATQEERLLILRMIDEGKISADEGARLLAAIGNTEPPLAAGATTNIRAVRTIRVRVTDPVTEREKVNVNFPIMLAEFALRFVPENVDVRIEKIRQAIQSGQMGRAFLYEDRAEGMRVEISLE